MPKSKAAKIVVEKSRVLAPVRAPGPGEFTTTQYDQAVYIDPGERYIGVALFCRDDFDNTWDCFDAFVMDLEAAPPAGIDRNSHELFEDWLWSKTVHGEMDILGFEKFRLFEDKAQEQKGRIFHTAELIGVIKYIARRNASQNRWPRQPLELVEFLPDHKKAAHGIMKSRGITSEAERRKSIPGNQILGDHAHDAELQGFYDLVHNRGFEYRRQAPT